jgi:hypothetical protein
MLNCFGLFSDQVSAMGWRGIQRGKGINWKVGRRQGPFYAGSSLVGVTEEGRSLHEK